MSSVVFVRRRHFLALGGMLLLARARAEGPPEMTVVDRVRLGGAWQLPRGQIARLSLGPRDEVRLDTLFELIADWQIPGSSSLVIELGAGEYRLSRTIRVNHPQGRQIRIVGPQGDTRTCRLVWPAGTDGFFVGEGTALGLLDGVTLTRSVADNNNGARDNACAVVASDGGLIACGSAVVADGFYYGFHARRGGVVRCNGSRATRSGDAGYFAWHGGHIAARNSSSTLASDSALGLGSGYVAEYGGTIDATGAGASRNLLAGFTALSGGALTASHAIAEDNGQYGFFAAVNGSIVAHDAIARRNRGAALNTREGGQISGNHLVLN